MINLVVIQGINHQTTRYKKQSIAYKGEMPVSPAEQKLFDDYTSRVKYFQDNNINEKDAQAQMRKWYEIVFKAYHINTKDFNQILKKMA